MRKSVDACMVASCSYAATGLVCTLLSWLLPRPVPSKASQAPVVSKVHRGLLCKLVQHWAHSSACLPALSRMSSTSLAVQLRP